MCDLVRLNFQRGHHACPIREQIQISHSVSLSLSHTGQYLNAACAIEWWRSNCVFPHDESLCLSVDPVKRDYNTIMK